MKLDFIYGGCVISKPYSSTLKKVSNVKEISTLGYHKTYALVIWHACFEKDRN